MSGCFVNVFADPNDGIGNEDFEMRLLFRVDDDIVDTDGMMQRVNEMGANMLLNAFENETAMKYRWSC